MFKKPTITVIVGPSGCGKSHILHDLREAGLVTRLITTTTRAPRAHEKDGVDYNFMDYVDAQAMIANNEFIESNEFNGHIYGITKRDFEEAMSSDIPPAVVVEPNGVTSLERACWQYGYDILKVYVHTPQDKLEERLRFRMYENLIYARSDAHREEIDRDYLGRVKNIHNEQRWIHTHIWDAIVDGTDSEKSLELFNLAVVCKNKKGNV